MTDRFIPEALYENGITDLISVIPPGAALAPSSKIVGSQLGKVPGRRLSSGLWAGYDWRKHEATIDDVRRWTIEGANVGLRADRYPGVDIDSTDRNLAQIIEDAAIAKLGAAPRRVGRWPKRLLMYRTDEPFGRMRLWIEKGDQHHLVEILGTGQQYVVHGIHPATMQAYEWDRPIDSVLASELTPITREQASAFLDYLGELLDMLAIGRVTREGDGRPISRTPNRDQSGLLAPSLELLREAVDRLPNSNELFPDRTGYLRVGYAIRAAAGEENEPEAFEIFARWAAKWEGNDRSPHGNDPDVVRQDWRRLKAPYEVGWSWLAEQARPFGFNDAALEFEATQPAPDDAVPARAPLYSDQWLAEEVVRRRRGEIRYVPMLDRWMVWQTSRWQLDAELLAQDIVKGELRRIANEVERHGATPKERAAAERLATRIASGGTAATVRTLIQSDRAIAVHADMLDHDPWVLNTPAGMIDLRTGMLGPPDPDQLSTRSTMVPADFSGAAPEWKRFLAEATGGDAELEQYLQRLAGYALTGSTREQHLTFIHGPGGNGKGVFLHTIAGILGDYARTATLATFTAAKSEQHSTDVAMLQGARLVTAHETAAGKRWDEQRLKSMTGGDPITARFMRQDNFTFLPQFKLILSGNHKPELRDIDDGIRRRLHLVPFTVRPAVVDLELESKLREEWPAILAWMIEGALTWQAEGLRPPAIVKSATDEYFAEEDAVGRWLEEATEPSEEGGTLTADLFQSWVQWANSTGETPGTLRRLSSALNARGYQRWRHPDSRRMGFAGLTLRPDLLVGV